MTTECAASHRPMAAPSSQPVADVLPAAPNTRQPTHNPTTASRSTSSSFPHEDTLTEHPDQRACRRGIVQELSCRGPDR